MLLTAVLGVGHPLCYHLLIMPIPMNDGQQVAGVGWQWYCPLQWQLDCLQARQKGKGVFMVSTLPCGLLPSVWFMSRNQDNR